jgi:hypothetical protein
MDELSIPLTAFITAHGLYEWTRMAFGHANAPRFFQPCVRAVLIDLIVDNTCEVYIEDIIIGAMDIPQLCLDLSLCCWHSFQSYEVCLWLSRHQVHWVLVAIASTLLVLTLFSTTHLSEVFDSRSTAQLSVDLIAVLY